MPKKRKTNRTSPKRAPRQPASALPASDRDEDWEDSEDYVSDVLHLDATYATPADAVKAFLDGVTVEWIGSVDGARMRHRVARGGDGREAIEQAVFVAGPLERMLVCAWHQAGPEGQTRMSEDVLAVLDVLQSAIRPVVEAEVRKFRPDYTAATLEAFREAPEPHGTGMPVFGWRTFHAVEPDTTWLEAIDTAAWNSSIALDNWHRENAIPELEPAPLANLLRRHDVPLVLCAGCGEAITDRHPRWTGTWMSLDSDGGALCALSLEPRSEPLRHPSPRFSWLTDNEFGDPHHPVACS
ncbi:hypothetical protein [Streptomyces vietnamensis]|uniref:Uncharacterized protein n=1 Tax=Streptomyces vietnamensis TaxID=362257 RepID=A0A0B5IIX4_9ACTN|nr:hypothetical protein [Streptomyces vietnamensis]AJF70417.1 hypothetical protein SVTN_40250 [Streptomyces vietnamensis]